MAEAIEIWSIIIGSLFGGIGTVLGIWNLVKSLVKKPKPTILEPVIQDLRHTQLNEAIIRIDFEIRNNGDRATRLYLYSRMNLLLNGKHIEHDIQNVDDYEGFIILEKYKLLPHCIEPRHFTFRFSEGSVYNHGEVSFIGHYFNHKNKKTDFLQIYSFKSDNGKWIVKKLKKINQIQVNEDCK